MAAGLPQLLMPMGFDQPDNAARIQRLGIGTSIKPASFRGPQVARALERLLKSDELAPRQVDRPEDPRSQAVGADV